MLFVGIHYTLPLKDLGCIQGRWRVARYSLVVFSAFDFLGNWNIIENSLLSFLNDWYIVDILDKTDDGDSIEKSGFYGIAFGKKNNLSEYKEIVIAYRGSQLFPIKEAYWTFFGRGHSSVCSSNVRTLY